MATIENYTADTIISGTDLDDSIRNNAGNVLIDSGAGNDTVSTDYGSKDVTIISGDGNNVINSRGGEFIKISVGSGDDTIANYSSNSTIDAGNGNNRIESSGNSVEISTGDGNDTIYNSSDSATIEGGQGNDFISLDSAKKNNLIIYNVGDGFDTIAGFSTDTRLQINGGDGSYSTQLSGTDIIVTVGEEQILLKTDNKYLEEININNEELPLPRLIRLKDGSDTVSNDIDNLTIVGGNGNDSIGNTDGDSIMIDAGEGNDTILNWRGLNVFMSGGAGDDYISDGGYWDNFWHDGGSNIIINGGAGNDTIYTHENSSSVTVNGDSGNDLIENSPEKARLSGGEGSDTIINFGIESAIEGGAGDDSIVNHASEVSINGGAGNDYIGNAGTNVIIDGGSGNDFIENTFQSSEVSINGGDGNDHISNYGSDVSINGGAGDDTITNEADNLAIDGGDGNNYIGNGNNNTGNNSTINTGAGKDTVWNGGNNVILNTGAGDDSIYNGGAVNVVINMGGGNDFIDNGGSNSTINGGDDKDTVWNGGVNNSIGGGAGDDIINNWKEGTNATIDGGEGNDLIVNYSVDLSIDGGEGSDTIRIFDGGNVTINGGAGNDNIRSGGFNILTDAGDGDDFITEYATNSTITTGLGNDTIAISSYAKNLTIIDLTPNDVLDFQIKPMFARFADGVLDMGSIKIALPSVQNIDAYRDMTVTWNRSTRMKLGTLLDAPAYVWTLEKVNGIMTARYGSESDDENIFTISGLKQDVTLNEDGILEGINFEFVSDNYGRVFFDDRTILGGNVTVESAKYDLIFRDHGDYTGKTLCGSNANNAMYIEGSGALIRSEDGNDFIGVYHSGNTVDTGNGDDEVYVTTSDNFIITGSGEDIVRGQGDNLTIQADDGNDVIDVSGFDNIITGGKGNDTVNAGGLEYIFTYSPGDGNDIVSRGAIINLIDGATVTETLTSDNDVILNFADGGSITIKDAVQNNDNYNFGIVENDNYQDYVGFETSTNNQPSRLITLGNTVKKKAKAENFGDNATIIADGCKVSLCNMGDEVVIDAKTSEQVILDMNSRNSTVETGDGPDTIRALSNDNDKNIISTGGGPDVINNNGTKSDIDCGDGSDYYYGCPNSQNTTVKGGIGPDTLETEGANSKLNGGPDGDVLANGDKYDVGEDIDERRKKALEDTQKGLIESSQAMREQWANDPVIQDILKNGADSEYLKHLPEKEREALAAFIQDTWVALNEVAVLDNTTHDISLISTIVGNFIQAIGESGELIYKKYGLDHSYLVQKLGNIIDPAYADKVILKNYPTIKAIQEAEKAAVKESLNRLNSNYKYAKTAEKIGKGLKTVSKRIKGVGTAIELLEFGTAVYNQISNPGAENFDNVILEGIDVLSSTIPIPFLDMAVQYGARKVYKWSADAFRNNFAKADSTRASKSRFMAFYGNSSNDLVVSETPEEFYMNNPNIGAVIGGDGNDIMLNNKRDNVWMDGGTDDDLIKNYNSSNVTVNGGTGEDVISNLNSSNTTINGGEGNDFILSNYSANVSINTAEGNNSVSVYDSSNVTVTTGDGDNSITNIGKHVTINTGTGSDDIFNIGAHVSIISGEGSDTVESVGDEATIDANAGDNYITAKGNNVVITAGSGANSIGTDEFYYGLIQTGDGADDIINFGDSNTIDAGNGSNSVSNIGDSNKIFSRNNDDYIGSFGDANTVSAGNDDDCIEVGGNSNSIAAGAGNDLILVYSGTDNTVNAGKDDDFIVTGSSEQMLLIYNLGDGNDTVVGFNSASTLQIGDGSETYSTQVSDSNIIVTVGEERIILADAASLAVVNIDGEEIFEPKWILNGTIATYGTPNETLITISGVKSTDGITLNGTKVILTDEALADCDKTITLTNAAGAEYKLALETNSTVKTNQENVKIKSSLAADGDNYIYSSTAYGEWYEVGDNSITYNAAIDAKEFTISGLSSAVTLGSNVKVTEGTTPIFEFGATALKKSNVSVSNGSVTLTNDVDTEKETIPESLSITNGTLNYTAAGTGEYYSVEGAQIIYTAEKIGDKFTLSGLKKTLTTADGVTISGNSVTVSEDALDMTATKSYSVELSGDNYSLDFKANTSNAETKATLNNGTYTSAYTPAYFKGSGKKYTFMPATSPTTFKISGLGSKAMLGKNIFVSDGKVKINAEALDSSHSKISLNTTDYEIELGDEVATVKTINFAQIGNNVTLDGATAGYKLINNSYERQEKIGGEEIKIRGLKSGATLTADMFTRKNGTVIFKPTQALLPSNPTTITFSNGVIDTSALMTSEAVAAHWNGTTYLSDKTAASWTTNASTVTYTAASGGDILFTLSGVSSPTGFTVEGETVKVAENTVKSLKNTVKIIGGNYTFEPSGTKSETIAAGWRDTNYYASAGKTAGFELGNNNRTLSYVASTTKPSVTIGGLKRDITLNDSNISVADKKIIIKSAELLTNGASISATNGYTVELDNKLAPIKTAAHFDALTFKSAANSDGYSLSADKKTVVYTPAVAESDLFSLTNVKNTESILVDTAKKFVTLSADNLIRKNISVTGDYKLKLNKEVPTSTTKTAGAFTKIASGTATYKTTAFSDYYSIKDNTVTYTAASGGKTVSIKNLKTSATLDKVKSGIAVTEQKDGSCKITFKSADILASKAPTITNANLSYTVVVDKSLKPATLAPDWKVSGTNASLKSDTSAGYSVKNNKVIYTKKVTGSPQVVLGGLVKNASLSKPVDKVLTLDSKILGKNSSLKSNASSCTVKLTGNMSKKSFTSTSKADTLNIVASNAAINGGAGNDRFTVSGLKVTLTGGKGNDTFKLSGKNPVLIYSTGDGKDTVNFVGGMQISLSGNTSIKTLGKSSSDLMLGFGKNSSIKVTAAKSTDTLKVIGSKSSVTLEAEKFNLAKFLTFNSKSSSVKVAKNFAGSLAPSDDIYLGGSKFSSVSTINAGNVTGKVKITGNAKANTILGGSKNDSLYGAAGNDSLGGNAGNDKIFGGKGNDTLWGGRGNDTLWGDAGADKFIYSKGDGKDVIFGFDNNDTLTLDNLDFSTSYSKKNKTVTFKVDGGSITLKEFTATTFHVNSDVYKISGSKLVKK